MEVGIGESGEWVWIQNPHPENRRDAAPGRVQVVQIETGKNKAADRFVNPRDNTAPSDERGTARCLGVKGQAPATLASNINRGRLTVHRKVLSDVPADIAP